MAQTLLKFIVKMEVKLMSLSVKWEESLYLFIEIEYHAAPQQSCQLLSLTQNI